MPTHEAVNTHDVVNQAPPLVDYNPFDAYPALGEALHREGGGWAEERVRDFGATVGSAEAIAHSRRALASPTLAYAQIAEPVEQEVEAERLVLRRGYRDAFARILEDGIDRGELEPHDTQTYGAAILGAISEALVGPLSDPRPRKREALIASLVQFTTGRVNEHSRA